MRKTIEEQIAGRCVHFNGMSNESCKAGINYRETFGPVLFEVVPCIKGGTATCSKCEYPTPEAVDEEVKRLNKGTVLTLTALMAVKKHLEDGGAKQGKIKCPNGDHELWYNKAESNGHVWMRCKVCEISVME